MDQTNPKTIVLVVTVGISLIHNFRRALACNIFEEKETETEKLIFKLIEDDNLSEEEELFLSKKIDYFLTSINRKWRGGNKEWIKTSIVQPNHRASAELQSIQEYVNQYISKGQKMKVYLMASDSAISTFAAKVIAGKLKQWYPKQFPKKNPTIEYQRIAGVKVNDPAILMEKGFSELLKYVAEIKNSTKGNYQLVINATGGFKGVIPILSLLGQLVSSSLLYCFEYGKNGEPGPIIEIPSLNVHFLWDHLEAYEPILQRVIASNKTTNQAHLEQVEKDLIRTELIPMRICAERQNNFKVEPLGQLLLSWISTKSPIAKSTVGFILEYKFLEYLMEEPWEDFLHVRRSVKPFGKEIDLYLENQKNKEWIWGEIKSYNKVQHAFNTSNNNSFGFSLTKQLNALKNSKYKIPNAYHLFIYKRPFQSLNDPYIQKHLKSFKESLEQYGIRKFNVFYVNLDLTFKDIYSSNENPYTTKLMPRKLTRNTQKYKEAQNNFLEQYEMVLKLNLSVANE